MSIPVPITRPRVPGLETVKYRVRVQAAVVGNAIDIIGHLEGWKFRRASHWQVGQLGNITVRRSMPSAGPEEYWLPWPSAERAKYVGLIIGVQVYADSSDPVLTATLYNRDAAPVAIDEDGCEWRVSAGTLVQQRIENDGGHVYPIRYVTTTARIVDADDVAGVTRPRCLNIPDTDAGKRLAVKLVAEHVRILSVTVFERPEITIE